MAETQTREWLTRLQSNGPGVGMLVLAALIVVELARIAILLLGGPVNSPQPVLPHGMPTHQQTGVDVRSVVSAHLFGTAVADPSTQDPNNAPVSQSSLVLAGTIATQDPTRGVAIVSEGGPARVFSVGDNLGGAKLHSVYLDHVILDRSGVLETLLLPRLLTGTRGAVAPASSRRGNPDPAANAAVDNIRRLVQQDPGILDQVMRVVASYDNAAGKLRGFRAYPGRNRAVFSKLGLKPGDLVTALNGSALDDPQHSQEVFNTIQTSDHVTVTIERGGQKQDITLNIAQVAAQASKDLEGDAGANGAAGSPSNGGPPTASPTGPAAPTPNGTNENSTD